MPLLFLKSITQNPKPSKNIHLKRQHCGDTEQFIHFNVFLEDSKVFQLYLRRCRSKLDSPGQEI